MSDSSKPFAAKKFFEIKGRRMACIDEGQRRTDRLSARESHLLVSAGAM